MPVQEFLFTVDPRTDKNLSSINEQLRSLTNREDPLTLDNFISFDVIGYSGLRSVVIRVTMEVNAFYARTTFPLNGSAFSQATAPQAIKLVFNSKVNESSITGTSIKYNGSNVVASNITLESDGYTLSVDTSGLSYNALQTHTIELISLKDRKGNSLSKQDVFSYVVGSSGSATSDRGNPEPYTYHDKVGDFKVTSFVIDRYAKIADKITEYLKTNNIDRDSVIAQDILNVNEHTLEVYILYFSDLFPSVIRTFPQEGALVSSDATPTEAVITFSQPTHINITEANNITVGGIDISANATLSEDKKTVKVGLGGVSAGNHFIKINNIYNELGRVRPSPPTTVGFTAGTMVSGGSGGIGSETDPIFSASPANNITNTNISNWDSAYAHSNATNNPHGVTFVQLTDTPSSTTRGDILYSDGTDLITLAIDSTATQFLKAGSNAPVWADITITDIDVSSFSPGDILYIDNNTAVTSEASGSNNNGKFLQQGSDGYPVWTAVEGGGGATTFSDLDNVDASVDEGAVTAGSLFYYNGTTWAALDPPNSVDHLLISTGAATNMPYWTGAIERLTGVWLNSSQLGQIGDVSNDPLFYNPSVGDVLLYTNAPSTPAWCSIPLSTDVITNINDVSKQQSDQLIYDTGTQKWIPVKINAFNFYSRSFQTFTQADDIVGVEFQGTDGTITYSTTGDQSYYTDILNPGSIYSINQIYTTLERNGSSFGLGSIEYSIYAHAVTGGVTYETSLIATGLVSNLAQGAPASTGIIVNNFTGQNIYLQFVFEKAITTFMSTGNAGISTVSLINLEIETIQSSTGASPFGSSTNIPISFSPKNLSDVYIDKTATATTTMAGNMSFSAGKGIEFDATYTPSTYGAVDKATLVSYVGAVDLGDLNNVTITTPSNDQVLTYSAGTWKNATAAGGGDSTQPEAFAWFVG